MNCMDCLDRTNVIESILANEVLQAAVSGVLVVCMCSAMHMCIQVEGFYFKYCAIHVVYAYCLQLQKLGVISFEDRLSGPMLSSFQEMWANNGDLVSRQYTGTAAMKVHNYSMYKFHKTVYYKVLQIFVIVPVYHIVGNFHERKCSRFNFQNRFHREKRS